MEKIVNVMKPKPKPEELLIDWQRRIRRARDIQREAKNVEETSNEGINRIALGSSSKMVVDAEAKDIQSDLYALKMLYGLLEKDGNESSNTTSDLLDENARLLLKNLLDAEAKRALKLHAEMIAGQVEASVRLSPPTQLHTPDRSSNDKKLGHLDMTLWNENRFNPPQGSQAGVVEQSEQTVVGNGPDYKNKRCRVCRRNTLKHLDSLEGSNIYDVGAQNSASLFNQNNVSNTEKCGSSSTSTVYTDFSSDDSRMISDFDEVCNYDVEAANKTIEADRVSQEVSEVIKQIELCISAFQIGADHLDLFEANSTQRQNCVMETKSRVTMSPSESHFQDRVGYLHHPVPYLTTEETKLPFFSSSQSSKKTVQPSNALWRQSAYRVIRNRGPALESDSLGESGVPIEECRFPVYKANNFHGQNVKAITDKIDSGLVIIDSASRMESPYQRRVPITDENNKHVQFRPSDGFMYLGNNDNALSVDSGLNVALSSGVRGKKHPPKLLKGPGFHENETYIEHKDGNPKNRQHYMIATEKLKQHQESEGTPTESYSSNSISQQSSSVNSDSKEYSSPGATNSNSWASSLSQRSESSYTSNSEDEVYSSTPTASSNSDASSSDNQKPIKHHAEPKYKEVKHKKQSGTWKRLKDRLAIIFHHHHHHHHHHDNQDDKEVKVKNKGKDIHHKREDEAYGERAVEKVGKAMVRDKNQKAHFHGLVEGLLKHVRRSKKSKVKKETTVGGVGEGQKRKKKGLKKSQWLKLLQHHRGVRKAQVKLGFGKKRTRLKALPGLE